jgi:O-antigen/teichoic acid export membrane protein
MLEIGLLIYAFSSFGVTAFLHKFFPYYSDNLESKDNDILSISMFISLVGFIFTVSGIYLLEDVIARKFSTNSRLLVEYFYWILPLGFFILLYSVLESYSYGFQKGVIANLLKETIVRLFTMIIILLKVFDFINFKTFIILFSLQYALIFFILAFLLAKEKKLWLSFRISRVTRKFQKKILTMLALTFVVIVVNVLRQSIDGLVLAAKQNLTKVGIFGLAAYMVSVLQAPFRSMVAITIPLLSRAWKNKDYEEISRIYRRSSINLLSFSLFVFFLIWLNFSQAIQYFGINPVYMEGRWVFFILGLVTIIEMGTGVNGQIIGTSSYWRFELLTSLLLTALIIPLSYYLTVHYGIFGPAFANLISFTIYNSIRYVFLLKKFNMQPFTSKTMEVIVIALIAYSIAYTLFRNASPMWSMIGASITYCSIFMLLLIKRKISPDMNPILESLGKRIGIRLH